jgi:hypothetical protein
LVMAPAIATGAAPVIDRICAAAATTAAGYGAGESQHTGPRSGICDRKRSRNASPQRDGRRNRLSVCAVVDD